jgi:hypothetical protein
MEKSARRLVLIFPFGWNVDIWAFAPAQITTKEKQ